VLAGSSSHKALFDAGYPILNISKETKRYFDLLIHSVEKENEKPFIKFVLYEFIKKCKKKYY